MQALSVSARQNGFREALQQAASLQPNIAIVFAAPDFWRDRNIVEQACAPLKGAHVIGCSTAGEMSPSGAADGTCSVLAMRFDRAQVKIAAAAIQDANGSRDAGKSIGDALKETRLRGIFALSPGLQVDGGAFVAGIAAAAGEQVAIAGGLAGDGLNFASTCTMLNGMVFPNLAVAFGLYGDVSMTSSQRCGWRAFGLARRVTKASGRVLHELDGKPALDLYRRYLGEDTVHMPASGMPYPVSILREDGSDTGLIRSVLGVDPAKGSVTLAGEVAPGSLLRMMYADPDVLVDDAKAAAAEAINGQPDPSATLIVSCAGRRAALGDDANAEIDAVTERAGPASSCAGFYSYGELIRTSTVPRPKLQNQSFLVTHIAEAAA